MSPRAALGGAARRQLMDSPEHERADARHECARDSARNQDPARRGRDHRQRNRRSLGAESQPQSRAKSNPIRQLPGQHRAEHRGYSEYDPIGGAGFETLTEAASNIIDQEQHVRDESDRVEPVLGKQRRHR